MLYRGVAKRTRHCHVCGAEIPAGHLYVELTLPRVYPLVFNRYQNYCLKCFFKFYSETVKEAAKLKQIPDLKRE